MYRQIITPTVGDISIPIPQSWYGQQIEVIAFPVTEVQTEPEKDHIAERRRRLMESGKKYSFNSKETGFKFDREEANNYDE
jgi:hypothetical protein